MLNNYDTEWVRAETAFRATQIRDEIRSARLVGRARRQRRLARWSRTADRNS